MDKNVLSVKAYLARYGANMRPDQLSWFKVSARPINATGNLETGVILFPEGEYAPGGGFPGNAAIYHIVDFSRLMQAKGRRVVKGSTQSRITYEDWDGMHDLVPYPLQSVRALIREELRSNRTSVYTYPHRFLKMTAKARAMTIDGHPCQRTSYSPKQLASIRLQLTPRELVVVLARQQLLAWSTTSPCKELPIRIRIRGNDDGAMEGLFATLPEARKAIRNATFPCSTERFKQQGFFHTD